MKKLMLLVLVAAATLCAGEKKLMHCFAFTAIESATDADWQAFFKATDALPGKIPVLSHVWYGKLQRPMTLFQVDAAARKELSGGAEKAKGEVSRVVRQWGVCMELDNEAALKTYADSPAHKEWEAVYSKVRVPGTTTVNLMGQ